MVFYKTSTRPIPRKYLHSPFGITTIIQHMIFSARVPFWNPAWKMTTTFLQCMASVDSYHVASLIHLRRCYSHIPDGSPERFSRSRLTAQETSSTDPPWFWHPNIAHPGEMTIGGLGFNKINVALGTRNMSYRSSFMLTGWCPY